MSAQDVSPPTISQVYAPDPDARALKPEEIGHSPIFSPRFDGPFEPNPSVAQGRSPHDHPGAPAALQLSQSRLVVATLNVLDLEGMRAWYEKMLGMQVQQSFHRHGCHATRSARSFAVVWPRSPPCDSARAHHGTGPWSLNSIPVGPSAGSMASRTGSRAASWTLRGPLCALRSVAVKPGHAALTLRLVPSSSFANATVIALSADLDGPYAIPPIPPFGNPG